MSRLGLGQAGGAKEKPDRRVNTPHIQAGIGPWGAVRKHFCLEAKVALVSLIGLMSSEVADP